MAEFTVLANTAGVRPATWACVALLAGAVAWASLSLGDEPAAGEPNAEKASQSAETPAAAVLGREVIEQANALRRDGDAEGAIALLRDYAPQNATMQAVKRMTLAQAYYDMEDWESAVAEFVGVMEAPGGLSPNVVAAASLSAGNSCMKLGRYDAAVSHWETWKIIAVEPQAGTQMAVDLQISRAYKELGQYAPAIENLEAALRIAEEEARTSDQDPKLVMYLRGQIDELGRLAAEE